MQRHTLYYSNKGIDLLEQGFQHCDVLAGGRHCARSGIVVDGFASISQRTASNDAAKFDEVAVPRTLDDPPVMNGDGWVDQIIAQRPRSRQRPVFVCAGALAVADNVSANMAAILRISPILLPAAFC